MKIQDGTVHWLVAFDIGFEIRMSQIPILFGNRQRDATGYLFLARPTMRDTQPIRIGLDVLEAEVGGQILSFQVYATFFDLGAVSLELIAKLGSDFHGLPRLAADFHSSKDLAAKTRNLAKQLFEQALPAVVNPELHPYPSDYLVFNVQRLDEPPNTERIISELGPAIAKTLRLSDDLMGKAEVNRALSPYVTYSDEDIVFASSQVAFVFDETSDEVIDIFELLNMQSTELGFIDQRLDRTLLSLYEDSPGKRKPWGFLLNLFEGPSRRLNTIHLDSTIVVERVEQSFKFALDSHLVRIHELGVAKLFLASYSGGIERKLGVIRNVITDQRDRASSLRMEVMEWIIVVLIALEVVPVIYKWMH